jgi:hypothetical protein
MLTMKRVFEGYASGGLSDCKTAQPNEKTRVLRLLRLRYTWHSYSLFLNWRRLPHSQMLLTAEK